MVGHAFNQKNSFDIGNYVVVIAFLMNGISVDRAVLLRNVEALIRTKLKRGRIAQRLSKELARCEIEGTTKFNIAAEHKQEAKCTQLCFYEQGT